MVKKIAYLALAILFAFVPLYAADGQSEELTGTWWYDRNIASFTYQGLQNVSARTINGLLRDFIGQPFTSEVEGEINNIMYSQPWLEYIESYEMSPAEDGSSININMVIHEIPMIDEIVFEGNEDIRSRVLEGEQNLKEGDFHSPGLLRANAALVEDYYRSRGYADASVDVYSEIDETDNTVKIVYTVEEGQQYKIANINFSGNNSYPAKDLKKEMTLKERSFFRSGNYVASTLQTDLQSLILFYNDNGYVDAQIISYEVVDSPETHERYHMVDINIEISEGEQWLIGKFSFEGNSVISTEELENAVYLREGAVNNYSEVMAQIQALASLYYNEGYIQTQINPQLTQNEDTHTIDYHLVIQESGQSIVEKIVITGLTKTKPYVLERELELHVGDVFSQEALQASGRNILNTGIITDISTGLYQGETENGVILEIAVEEGNQMQLQFGATFGGNVGGFPVSGFLQWSDRNLFGTGRDFAITTNLSPDNQQISLSLSDDWVGNARWSNGVSLGFERSVVDNVLQRGSNSDYFNGRDEEGTNPSDDRMNYDFYTISLGYSTGYTFTFRPGNLTLSGGVSVGLSHAVYDDNYDPYELLIKKYHDKWQFSNKLNLSLTWDGRDLIENTTKGYVLSLGYTYAGGILGGLSNYNRINASASGYVPLFTYTNEEGESRSLVLSGTTSVSVMLPQYWNSREEHGWDWYDSKLGTTRYERIYLDGMNTARGFSPVLDLGFLWHNQVELSYPLVRNVLNIEGFVSADGTTLEGGEISDLHGISDLQWYFAGGFGIKLRIPGFPLGLYWVKNATLNEANGFDFVDGSIFGGSIVLAITTSIY